MLEQIIRGPYQAILVDPLARRLANSLSPLTVTLLALVCGLLSALMLFKGYSQSALALLLLSGYMDTLDGTLARLNKAATPKGAMTDIVSDRAVEAALIIGLYAVAPNERALMCLLMLASVLLCVTSFLVVAIFSANGSQKGFYYSPGIMERAEAFVFFGLMIITPAYFIILAVVFCVLVLLTALIRLLEFDRQVK